MITKRVDLSMICVLLFSTFDGWGGKKKILIPGGKNNKEVIKNEKEKKYVV